MNRRVGAGVFVGLLFGGLTYALCIWWLTDRTALVVAAIMALVGAIVGLRHGG